MESLIESLSHPLPGFEGQLPITFFFMLPVFWAAVFILNKFMLTPVIDTVDRRKAASSGTSEGAAHMQSEAEKLLREYGGRLQSATDDAAGNREKMIAQTRSNCDAQLAEARAAAEAAVTSARQEIRKESDTARKQLESEVDKIAAEMARKVLGRAA